MAEKLIIKNFAGIQNLEIEVKRINILIGPQASGKSVCAKLLFYFKNFVWEILSAVENEQTQKEFNSTFSRRFEEYFPPDSWGEEDFRIRYEVDTDFIEIFRQDNSRNSLYLGYTDFFKTSFTSLEKLLKESRETEESFAVMERITNRRVVKNYYMDSLNRNLCGEASFNQLFIPAGRSFFAILQENMYSFLSNNNSLDPFLREFGLIYERLKSSKTSSRRTKIERVKTRITEATLLQQGMNIEEINNLAEKALCGKHIYEDKKDFLDSTDGRRVSIANSSSGQQEVLPLTIMLAALPSMTMSRSGQTVYIEEPEAHLFPNAQRSIIELIATVFNSRPNKLQFFITTHSPYVLTVFNTLLQAGSLYGLPDKEKYQQLEKIISKHKALDIADVSAYLLIDGQCRSIVSGEDGLIDAAAIDQVSDELAIQFEKLLDLM
jgi:predicted ATP-dependent endonuclease of OLD family